MRLSKAIAIICKSALPGLVLLALALAAHGQQKPKKWAFSGYIKHLQTVGFSKIKEDWQTDNLLHNRLNFRWFPTGNFTFAIEARNRFFYGETVKTYSRLSKQFPALFEDEPTYGEFIDQESRIVQLSHPWLDEQSFVLHSEIDRFYIDYYKNDWQIRLGRQRINWGICFIWNPHDLFNTYSFIDFDYEERPGTDALRVQYYTGALSQVELAVQPDLDSLEQSVVAGLFKFNKWQYDFQLLAGSYREKLAAGIGWSGNIKDANFSGEVSLFQPFDRFQEAIVKWVAALSAGYVFTNSLSLSVELLYNSNYESPQQQNLLAIELDVTGPDNLFPAEWAFFGQAGYQITPLLRGSVGAAWAPTEDFYLIVPSLDLSVKENLDLTLIAQLFQGETFENPFFPNNLLYARWKWSF